VSRRTAAIADAGVCVDGAGRFFVEAADRVAEANVRPVVD
jgi:hypothetical protein